MNPISGTSSKAGVAASIEKYLDKELFDSTLVATEYAGHATELAKRAAADGVDVCVAVGGDGTVNEVARALVHTQTALGIIPVGRAMGWRAISCCR